MGYMLAGGLFVQAAPPQDVLRTHVQTALVQTQTAGTQRFRWMRFFVPTNTFRPNISLWDRWFSSTIKQQHERAFALYLFNMYVSTNLYKQPAPKYLTLNFLGVLDGFEICQQPFDFSEAADFYQNHKVAILTQFNIYLHAYQYPWKAPTEQDFVRWVNLLQTVPRHRQQVAYTFPASNLLDNPLPNASSLLHFPLQAAHAQAAKRVIIFDQPHVNLEDFDNPFRASRSRNEGTYRWVKDECYYSSYLIARNLVQEILKDRASWKSSHVYLLTALPQKTEFLVPASGERFVLANASNGLHWRYHTVVLLLLEHNRNFYPLIIDPFLTGDSPVNLGQWLAHFSTQTVFKAQPFRRREEVEKAILTPDVTDGTVVWIKGKKYDPAPVLK